MRAMGFLLCFFLSQSAGCESLWGSFYKNAEPAVDPAAKVDWTTPPSHLWSMRLGGPGADSANAVAIAPDGSVVIVGVVELDAPSLSANGGSDPQGAVPSLKANGYLLKISSAGAVRWARNLPNLGATVHQPRLAIDPRGNIFVGWQQSKQAILGDSLLVTKFDTDGNIDPGWGDSFRFGNQGGSDTGIDLRTIDARSAGSDPQRTRIVVGGWCHNETGIGSLPGPGSSKPCAEGSYLLSLEDNNGPTLQGTVVYDTTSLRTQVTQAALMSDGSSLWTGGGVAYTDGKTLLYRAKDNKNIPIGGPNQQLGPGGLNIPIALDQQDNAIVAVRLVNTQLLRYATGVGSGEPGPFMTLGGSDAFPLGLALDGADNPILAGFFGGMLTLTDKVLQATGERDIFLVKYNSALTQRLWSQQVWLGNTNPTMPYWPLAIASDRIRNRLAFVFHTRQGQGYKPFPGQEISLDPPATSPGNDVDAIVVYMGVP